MRLLIIGNGFDLYHGLKTGYKDYAHFLQEHYPETLENVQSSKYFDGTCSDIFDSTDLFWTDIESNLKFNFDLMLEETVDGYYPDLTEKSDARWHRAEFDSEEKVKMVDITFTTNALVNWIQSIDVSKADESRKVKILPSDVFVSFNYTETLEKVYKVPSERILHIHGCISNPDSLQFGNPDQTPSVVRKKFEDVYGEDEFYGMSIEPAANNYVALADSFSKDIDSNIPKLDAFLAGKDIDEVVIMGHSYLGVDKPYYEKVLLPRFLTAKWTIFCYTDKDFDVAQKYISEKKLRGKAVFWS